MKKNVRPHVLAGPGYEIAVADATHALREIPDSSVHCAVTSVPYWSLRDYGVDGQIGLEASPADWCARLVGVCEEIRRVLREDGTFWLNVGDSYAQGGRGGIGGHFTLLGSRRNLNESRTAMAAMGAAGRRAPAGLKNKDLVGQPWMLAFALRAAGWYLRADIIWSKKNSMPESIKDRPCKSHEYVFLLAKSPRYYYDLEAIREPYKPESIARRKYRDEDVGARSQAHQPGAAPKRHPPDGAEFYDANPAGRNRRSVWDISTARFDQEHFATFPEELVEPCVLAGTSAKGVCPRCGAPWKRMIAKGAADLARQRAAGGDANGEFHGRSERHEGQPAPFTNGPKTIQNPSEVKSRILAGMTERRTTGWRPTCGCSPSAAHAGAIAAARSHSGVFACADPSCAHSEQQHSASGECGRCRCEVFRQGDPYPPVPATVLDPFSGAATTGLVAIRLGRRYLGVELSSKYAQMSQARLDAGQLARDFGRKPSSPAEKQAMESQMRLFEGGA